MFSYFFYGLQQDIKLLCVAPVVCALFRAIFIAAFGPYTSLKGQGAKFWHCFRYGFWWGMDWNAYVLAAGALFVSLPGAFFPGWYAAGDTARLAGLGVYLVVLYTAFWGKLLFYYHYRDIYNHLLWMGKHADKKNLLDIFFHQNHGAWILLSYLPFLAGTLYLTQLWLATPRLPYPALDGAAGYAFNFAVVLAAVALFYYCRFGGTFRHADKPEWDEIPPVVKADIFLAKATVDDLVALEIVWKHPMNELLTHSDEDAASRMDSVMPSPDWRALPSPLLAFRRRARGARITPPRHIFYLLAESYEQAPLDAPYECLHIAEGGRRFAEDPHTFSPVHFLAGGTLSQTSLVAQLLGIYDANLELNEREDFWHGAPPTALARQLKSLGYRCVFWYGGALNWASLQHFLPAAGFDAAYGGPDICGPKAPRTWLGVYDHLFLEEAARRIPAMEDEGPALHLLYTTANHGPYTIPVADYGYTTESVMPEAPDRVKADAMAQRRLGCYWYADWALFRFVSQMKALYPDSLFLVTGDHTMRLIPFEDGIVNRPGPTVREQAATYFAIHHPELAPDQFAGNTIGSHMNILPTLMELLAPAGHEYLSLFPPLTEPIDHIVTPYHWLTPRRVGNFGDACHQPLWPADGEPPRPDDGRWQAERDGWRELSGWLARHPELLTRT